MYPSIYTSIHRSLPSLLDRLLHAAVKAMVQPDGAVVAALPDAAAAIDLNHPDNDGDTPLMRASYCGKPEVVRVLLAAGADKDLRNNDGKTALDYAIEEKKDACAALLRPISKEVKREEKRKAAFEKLVAAHPTPSEEEKVRVVCMACDCMHRPSVFEIYRTV